MRRRAATRRGCCRFGTARTELPAREDTAPRYRSARRTGRGRQRHRQALATKCSMSVVLPIPGSPATQTIARLPLHAMSQARRSRDSGSARPMKWGTCAAATLETLGWTLGAAGIALGAAMKRYPRRDTVSMKRGLRASSSSAVRSSLMAVLNTESVTNWWPQTSSSKAFVVSRDPGCRTSAHRTANGVGASDDSGSVAQQARVRLVELESVEAHSYRIRTGRRSGVVGAFSHFDTYGSLGGTRGQRRRLPS